MNRVSPPVTNWKKTLEEMHLENVRMSNWNYFYSFVVIPTFTSKLLVTTEIKLKHHS